MLLSSVNKKTQRSVLTSKDSQSAKPENLDGWRMGITRIEMRGSVMYKLIALGPIAEMSQIS